MVQTQDSSSVDTPDLIGGRYAIEKPLGEGAMGEVYLAEHVMMQKTVALKVLRGDLSRDDEAVARFQREARAAASLDHPHVCQATDFGQTDDGDFFLVMEHLEGETLQHQIETFGSLTVDRALHIADQIADGLHQAHQQGIVHRDLKPENIMLIDRQGDRDFVKIMDFGIARLVAGEDSEATDEERLTRAGMVYGTPHYMAPEQVAGDDIDLRADLYALGIVLFEMLTGQPPFDGDNIAKVMGQHITQPIPSLQDVVDDRRFAPELQSLVDVLLDKDLEQRPDSAEAARELINDARGAHQRRQTLSTLRLDEASDHLRDIGEQTKRLGAKTRDYGLQRWSKLSKIQRLLVSTIAVWFFVSSFVLFFGAVWWFGGGFDRPTPGEQRAATLAEAQDDTADDDEVQAAIEALEHGDLEPFQDLIDAYPEDAHLAFIFLRHRLNDSDLDPDLVASASHILDLDSRYRDDPFLIDALVDAALDNDDEAYQFLIDHPSETVLRQIGGLAFRHDSSSRRQWAQDWLDDAGQWDELPDWTRYSIALRQAHGCDPHKEKIDALVDTGASEALEIIEIYRAKPTRGCGTLRRRDCYDCIRDDLDDAAEALGAQTASD